MFSNGIDGQQDVCKMNLPDWTDSETPQIGVSACLLGQELRYDGGHREKSWVPELLERGFSLLGFCPEVEAGLGIPREPIRLVSRGATEEVLGVMSAKDFTASLRSAVERRCAELSKSMLDGLIVKARSPSCGLADTPIFGEDGLQQRAGSGFFTGRLGSLFPDLPIEDDESLEDPEHREAFLKMVRERFHQRRGS